MRMVAVGGDHVIVGLQHTHRARYHGFLPDVEVTESFDLLHAVQLSCTLLESSHEQQLFVPLQVLLFGEFAFRHNRVWTVGKDNRKSH